MSSTENAPSIFNDVLGPVMRGPSSSHCAAANRIGRLCRDLAGGAIRRVAIEYDPGGSLATTHESQGSDMGLYGGFLGWEPDDPRLPDYRRHVAEAGLEIQVAYVPRGAVHPNTYRLTLETAQGLTHAVVAVSTGGGMIELAAVDGAAVKMTGDCFETLVFLHPGADGGPVRARIESRLGPERVQVSAGDAPLLVASTRGPPPADALSALAAQRGVRAVRTLRPVLPVLSRKAIHLPFEDAEGLRAHLAGRAGDLGQLAVAYESARAGISREEVLQHARCVLQVMQAAVATGLAGTEYADRILPCQSVGYRERWTEGKLIPGDVLNRTIAYVSAVMEVKSSMGCIVAAPTAGACGAVPGAVLAVADELNKDEAYRLQAVLAAGLIGVFILRRSTFAAEVAGCMAECGSASAMAAGALASLAGGNLDQQLGAASMALQNSFGMTCDPIANRVEAPCLTKNVMAAVNALACANMALAGYRHLIPLDEVIRAMDQVGRALPRELRCTALGGLSLTPSAKAIEKAITPADGPGHRPASGEGRGP